MKSFTLANIFVSKNEQHDYNEGRSQKFEFKIHIFMRLISNFLIKTFVIFKFFSQKCTLTYLHMSIALQSYPVIWCLVDAELALVVLGAATTVQSSIRLNPEILLISHWKRDTPERDDIGSMIDYNEVKLLVMLRIFLSSAINLSEVCDPQRFVCVSVDKLDHIVSLVQIKACPFSLISGKHF